MILGFGFFFFFFFSKLKFYKLQGRHKLNPSAAVETINPGICG